MCVCGVSFLLFLHRPHLLHVGMGGGLGGKIELVGVMSHSLCVVFRWLGIGDNDRGIGVGGSDRGFCNRDDGKITVGDCSVVLRELCGECSAW